MEPSETRRNDSNKNHSFFGKFFLEWGFIFSVLLYNLLI